MAHRLWHMLGISGHVKVLYVGPFHGAEIAFLLHFVVIFSKPQSLSLHQRGLVGLCSPGLLANL